MGELTDSVGGIRPRPIITTRISIRAVTRSQVLGQSASQPGTDKSSLADKYTRQASQPGTEKSYLADKYTRQAPLTSLPDHGPANIRHHHRHLLILLDRVLHRHHRLQQQQLQLPQIHLVLHLLRLRAHHHRLQLTSAIL